MVSSRPMTWLVAIVVLALLTGQCTAQDQCGVWQMGDETTCVRSLDGAYFKSNLQLEGVSSGDLYIEYSYFNDTNSCNQSSFSVTPMLKAAAVGVWWDNGPNPAQPDTERLFAGWLEEVTITASTDLQVENLKRDCPCGVTWTKGTPQTLKSCPTGTCPKPTFLNSVEIGELQFGQFFYGVSENTQDTLGLSRWSSNAGIGFNTSIAVGAQYGIQQPCPTPETNQEDYCGAFKVDCRPVLPGGPLPTNDSSVKSMSRSLTWELPKATMDADDTGIYTREIQYFAGTHCDAGTEKLLVVETGVLSSVQGGGIAKANSIALASAGVNVTSYDDVTTAYLQQSCSCGGTWATHVTKRLSYCPQNECPLSPWYSKSGLVSSTLYAQALVQNAYPTDPSRLGVQLQTTEFFGTPEEAAAVTEFSGSSYALPATNQGCTNQEGITDNFCGSFSSTCNAYRVNGAGPGAFSGFNYVETFTMEGEGSGNDEKGGTIETVRRIYNAPGCDDLTVESIGRGVWSMYETTDPQVDLEGLIINIGSYVVTAFSKDMALALNQSCSCGGNWQANVPRVLTSCSCDPDISEAIFGGSGFIGEPYFAVAREQFNSTLRVSRFSNSSTALTQSFGLSGFPMFRTKSCAPATPWQGESLCGVWDLPCSASGFNATADLDYTSRIEVDDAEEFEWNINFFTRGVGCAIPQESDTNVQYAVLMNGKFQQQGTAAAVTNGRQIEALFSSAEVFPATDQATALLNNKCPCGGTWTKNKPRVLTSSCPLNSCDTTLFPLPLGTTGYGAAQILEADGDGAFARFTQFLSTVSGYNNALRPENLGFVLLEDTCKKHQSPTSKSGIDTGGILLLIAFFAMVIYFGGGMALNYKDTGSPVIPHSDFWRNLPGLVMDGISFSLCQCCGVRGSSGRYSSMGDSGGYGTL